MTDDLLQEYLPTGWKQVLQRRDQIIWQYMKRIIKADGLYTDNEIYDAIRYSGVNDELVASGFHRISRRGRKEVTTMVGTLNNLWWSGKVRKFAARIDGRSGRPSGIKWMMEYE